MLPALMPAGLHPPPGGRVASPNTFKRTGWTTPRAVTGEEPLFPGIDTPSRQRSRSLLDDAAMDSDPDWEAFQAAKPSPRRPEDKLRALSQPPDVALPLDAERNQLAYMEQMYNTINMLSAELDRERQDRTRLEDQATINRLVTESEYAPSDTASALTTSLMDTDDASYGVSPMLRSPATSTISPRSFRPSPPQPHQPKRPTGASSLVSHLPKDQVELCAALGKNAELRIRTREMERTADKSSLELEQAQKQVKLAERRISNREDKLRGLLKEKMHWQKELKDMRDQVVEEKMRQVDIFRRMETLKREHTAQLEEMEATVRDANAENEELRAHVAELRAQQAYQAKRMEELVRQAKDEKESFTVYIAETRQRFKEWKENEANTLRAAREQALSNLKTEYDLKIARHQEEKQKLRDKVKDLEVSLKLMQKDRTLSPLELRLRKATILGNRDNGGTSEAELIELHARIRELETLLEHSQEYQKRQDNIIKVSEATISRLVQEREVTALENLSAHPLTLSPAPVGSEDLASTSSISGYALSPRSPRDVRKPSQFSSVKTGNFDRAKSISPSRPTRSYPPTTGVGGYDSDGGGERSPERKPVRPESLRVSPLDLIAPIPTVVTPKPTAATPAQVLPPPSDIPSAKEQYLVTELARLRDELEQVKLRQMQSAITTPQVAERIDARMVPSDSNEESESLKAVDIAASMGAGASCERINVDPALAEATGKVQPSDAAETQTTETVDVGSSHETEVCATTAEVCPEAKLSVAAELAASSHEKVVDQNELGNAKPAHASEHALVGDELGSCDLEDTRTKAREQANAAVDSRRTLESSNLVQISDRVSDDGEVVVEDQLTETVHDNADHADKCNPVESGDNRMVVEPLLTDPQVTCNGEEITVSNSSGSEQVSVDPKADTRSAEDPRPCRDEPADNDSPFGHENPANDNAIAKEEALFANSNATACANTDKTQFSEGVHDLKGSTIIDNDNDGSARAEDTDLDLVYPEIRVGGLLASSGFVEGDNSWASERPIGTIADTIYAEESAVTSTHVHSDGDAHDSAAVNEVASAEETAGKDEVFAESVETPPPPLEAASPPIPTEAVPPTEDAEATDLIENTNAVVFPEPDVLPGEADVLKATLILDMADNLPEDAINDGVLSKNAPSTPVAAARNEAGTVQDEEKDKLGEAPMDEVLANDITSNRELSDNSKGVDAEPEVGEPVDSMRLATADCGDQDLRTDVMLAVAMIVDLCAANKSLMDSKDPDPSNGDAVPLPDCMTVIEVTTISSDGDSISSTPIETAFGENRSEWDTAEVFDYAEPPSHLQTTRDEATAGLEADIEIDVLPVSIGTPVDGDPTFCAEVAEMIGASSSFGVSDALTLDRDDSPPHPNATNDSVALNIQGQGGESMVSSNSNDMQSTITTVDSAEPTLPLIDMEAVARAVEAATETIIQMVEGTSLVAETESTSITATTYDDAVDFVHPDQSLEPGQETCSQIVDTPTTAASVQDLNFVDKPHVVFDLADEFRWFSEDLCESFVTDAVGKVLAKRLGSRDPSTQGGEGARDLAEKYSVSDEGEAVDSIKHPVSDNQLHVEEHTQCNSTSAPSMHQDLAVEIIGDRGEIIPSPASDSAVIPLPLRADGNDCERKAVAATFTSHAIETALLSYSARKTADSMNVQPEDDASHVAEPLLGEIGTLTTTGEVANGVLSCDDATHAVDPLSQHTRMTSGIEDGEIHSAVVNVARYVGAVTITEPLPDTSGAKITVDSTVLDATSSCDDMNLAAVFASEAATTNNVVCIANVFDSTSVDIVADFEPEPEVKAVVSTMIDDVCASNEIAARHQPAPATEGSESTSAESVIALTNDDVARFGWDSRDGIVANDGNPDKEICADQPIYASDKEVRQVQQCFHSASNIDSVTLEPALAGEQCSVAAAIAEATVECVICHAVEAFVRRNAAEGDPDHTDEVITELDQVSSGDLPSVPPGLIPVEVESSLMSDRNTDSIPTPDTLQRSEEISNKLPEVPSAESTEIKAAVLELAVWAVARATASALVSAEIQINMGHRVGDDNDSTATPDSLQESEKEANALPELPFSASTEDSLVSIEAAIHQLAAWAVARAIASALVSAEIQLNIEHQVSDDDEDFDRKDNEEPSPAISTEMTTPRQVSAPSKLGVSEAPIAPSAICQELGDDPRSVGHEILGVIVDLISASAEQADDDLQISSADEESSQALHEIVASVSDTIAATAAAGATVTVIPPPSVKAMAFNAFNYGEPRQVNAQNAVNGAMASILDHVESTPRMLVDIGVADRPSVAALRCETNQCSQTLRAPATGDATKSPSPACDSDVEAVLNDVCAQVEQSSIPADRNHSNPQTVSSPAHRRASQPVLPTVFEQPAGHNNPSSVENRRASTRRATKRSGSILAVEHLLAWAISPDEVDAAENTVKRYATKRRVSRRSVSEPSRILDPSSGPNPHLLAYDLSNENGHLPSSILDDEMLRVDLNSRRTAGTDETDQASEIIAKRKKMHYEAYCKSMTQRTTPAFNYAPVQIKFEWSDFVVASPVSPSARPSPVQKLRLLHKKGVRLPCGQYVIVSAFVRPLEDGNESLRVQIYDSERVEEFIFDFFDDHIKKYVVEWSGKDEQAREFVAQLEFRREQGAVIIKLPEKKGVDALGRRFLSDNGMPRSELDESRVGSSITMEPAEGEGNGESRTPRAPTRRRIFSTQRPSTSPDLSEQATKRPSLLYRFTNGSQVRSEDDDPRDSRPALSVVSDVTESSIE